jgi:acyl-CoA synthetase (AMP-forming)/AMP-acid ligase II
MAFSQRSGARLDARATTLDFGVSAVGGLNHRDDQTSTGRTHLMDTAEQSLPDWARPRHAPTTLSRLLAASVGDHATASAVIAPGRPDLTYGELGRVLETIASQLADAGFGRETRIGIALPEGPELVVAILAVCSAATCAPLNDALDEEALVRLLVAMRIEALIVTEGSTSAAARAARRAGVVVIALRTSPRDQALVLELVPASRRDRVAVSPPRADDIALLVHTSGTTGTPKVVPWEQWRVAETVRNRVELSRIDGSDRCLVVLPLYSSAAIRRTLAGLLTGGAIICPGPLSADATIDLLESLAPTQYFASPASHIALLEAFERRVPRAASAPWSESHLVRHDRPARCRTLSIGAGVRCTGRHRIRNDGVRQHCTDAVSASTGADGIGRSRDEHRARDRGRYRSFPRSRRPGRDRRSRAGGVRRL